MYVHLHIFRTGTTQERFALSENNLRGLFFKDMGYYRGPSTKINFFSFQVNKFNFKKVSIQCQAISKINVQAPYYSVGYARSSENLSGSEAQPVSPSSHCF